jgi:hypothetical protein
MEKEECKLSVNSVTYVAYHASLSCFQSSFLYYISFIFYLLKGKSFFNVLKSRGSLFIQRMDAEGFFW